MATVEYIEETQLSKENEERTFQLHRVWEVTDQFLHHGDLTYSPDCGLNNYLELLIVIKTNNMQSYKEGSGLVVSVITASTRRRPRGKKKKVTMQLSSVST